MLRTDQENRSRKSEARSQKSGLSFVFCFLFSVFFVALLGLTWQVGGTASAQETIVDDPPTPAAAPKGLPGGIDPGRWSPTPAPRRSPQPDQHFDGWEMEALRDLASVLSWPTAVTFDSVGRLRVHQSVAEDRWSTATIRAFDYSAGAEAGFVAEQEDTQLAGFSLTPETFYTYPAYLAVRTGNNGAVIERRFHFVARSWIIGVTVHQSAGGGRAIHPRLIAEQLLSLAVMRGMPAPPGGFVPTPDPTWALPPVVTPTARACNLSFSDVSPGHWSYAFVMSLACRGVVSGYADGTFRPENPTTRAQFAKMVVLSRRWAPTNPVTPSFDDVSRQHPFYEYIETAVDNGVITGYGDGTFRPEDFVTRAQVAKMLVLANRWSPPTTGTVTLVDVDPNHWAWSYVQTALYHGVFSGYGDRRFRPYALATRAQLAKVLTLAR